MTPPAYTFVDRGESAYTMYVDHLPVALIAKVRGTWVGLMRDQGKTELEGASRKAVAEQVLVVLADA